MPITVALGGDTMLGRMVAERFDGTEPPQLFSDGVTDALSDADLVVLNLECCISERGSRWPEPRKPFFFRAPPAAADLLADVGVDVVTLGNNHALDYGEEALLDTIGHLDRVGIASTGAGPDVGQARRPAVLEAAGARVAVIGLTDHPADFAATADRPGTAFADLRREPAPGWLLDTLAATDADVTVVTPHWGPNMVAGPVPHVRAAAGALVGGGATVVAGHSAHVFHGVAWHRDSAVLYDLGDLIDDYAVDRALRNDLGLLWLVEADRGVVRRIEAVPLLLDYCFTRLADGEDARWIANRLRDACAPFGTAVEQSDGRLRLSRGGS